MSKEFDFQFEINGLGGSAETEKRLAADEYARRIYEERPAQ